MASPGTAWLRRVADGMTYVSTNVGVTLSSTWVGGTVTKIEGQTLDGDWVEVQASGRGNVISPDVMTEWSQRTGLQFVEFRLSR